MCFRVRALLRRLSGGKMCFVLEDRAGLKKKGTAKVTASLPATLAGICWRGESLQPGGPGGPCTTAVR